MWHLIKDNDYPTEEKEYLVTVVHKKMDGEDRYLDLAHFTNDLFIFVKYGDKEHINKKGFFKWKYFEYDGCADAVEMDDIVAWSDIQPYRD